MSSRELVLDRISRALNRAEVGSGLTISDQPASVTDRLNRKARATLPALAADTIDTLIDRMESVQMSVVRLQSALDCISAIDWYLESQGIDASATGAVTVAPALAHLAWPDTYTEGPATGNELVGITPCVGAVAETGSVVTFSGEGTPATLNFLPETHILMLYESQIVRHVDDIFALIRQADELPRAVNFLTGPSRTADIEQTLEIGAHGPRRMHVLLIAGSAPDI